MSVTAATFGSLGFAEVELPTARFTYDLRAKSVMFYEGYPARDRGRTVRGVWGFMVLNGAEVRNAPKPVWGNGFAERIARADLYTSRT